MSKKKKSKWRDRSTQLKFLQSQLKKLESEQDLYKKQQSEISKNLSEVDKTISDVKQQINNLTSSNNKLVISEHAKVRMYERMCDIDIVDIENTIMESIKEPWSTLGDGDYPFRYDGESYYAKIKNSVIITIYKP